MFKRNKKTPPYNHIGNGVCYSLLLENPTAGKHTRHLKEGGKNGNEQNGDYEKRNRENLFQSHQGKVPGLFWGRAFRSTGLLGKELSVVPVSVWQETRVGNQRIAEVLHRESDSDRKERMTPWKKSD